METAVKDPREARRAYKREWAARNPEKVKEYQRRYWAKKVAKQPEKITYAKPKASHNMSEEEYRAAPGVNKSTLWAMRKSPAHYKYCLEHQESDTPTLKLGRAIHAAILQPRQFKKMFIAIPSGIDRRTKEGKAAYEAFMQEAAGRDVLTADEKELCDNIAAAIKSNHAAAALLNGCETETALFWQDEETGIDCKCRVDAMKPGIAIDIKSCTDASTRAFIRDALKYGYDAQAAHYLRGIKATNGGSPVEWYFIAVEKAAPYAVNVIHASDGFITRGTWLVGDLLEKLKECRISNEWPDYGESELILREGQEIPDNE